MEENSVKVNNMGIDQDVLDIFKTDMLALLGDNNEVNRILLNFFAEDLSLTKKLHEDMLEIGKLLTIIFNEDIQGYMKELSKAFGVENLEEVENERTDICGNN